MVTSRPILFGHSRAQRWDRGILALLVTFVVLLPLFQPRLYATDSVQYYAYLRSLWFDGDLDFANEYTRFHELNPKSGIDKALLPRIDPGTGEVRNVVSATGKLVNVAPIGSALLWSPAFAVAHGAVLIARGIGVDVAADGYSAPYIWAICFASVMYGLAGLLFSYSIARRFVGVWPATAATIVCWLASPLVFYMYISPPWSHTGSFFTTALFIWYWLRTYGRRTLRQWLVLGLLGSLMTLTREQLGLFLLLPAIEALHHYWQSVRAFDWLRLRGLVIAHSSFLFAFALTLSPQFVTYRVLNGRWGPAKTVAQKFDWSSPHFWDTLIDVGSSPITGHRFAHGAFLWTPTWALGVAGLLLLWRRNRFLAALLLLVFCAQVWINGSFGTTWHLSSAFGFRRLIEATPLFVLGVALLMEHVRLPRRAWSVLIALLIVWNIGLIAQWTATYTELRRGLVWDGMLTRQLSVPVDIGTKLGEILFDRCALVENCGSDTEQSSR